jgi:hypothetical protein
MSNQKTHISMCRNLLEKELSKFEPTETNMENRLKMLGEEIGASMSTNRVQYRLQSVFKDEVCAHTLTRALVREQCMSASCSSCFVHVIHISMVPASRIILSL